MNRVPSPVRRVPLADVKVFEVADCLVAPCVRVANVVAEAQERACLVLRNQAEHRPTAGCDPRPGGISHPVGELHTVKPAILAPELAPRTAVGFCNLSDPGFHQAALAVPKSRTRTNAP